MANTLSTLLSAVKVGIGEARDTWGTFLNANVDIFDAAFTRRRYEELPTTGGTTAAFTLTATQVPALYEGLSIQFKLHAPCAANATLNVNSLGAHPLKVLHTNTYRNPEAGELTAVVVYEAIYSSSTWIVTDEVKRPQIIGVDVHSVDSYQSTTSLTQYAAKYGGSALFNRREENSNCLVLWWSRYNADGNTNTSGDCGLYAQLQYYTGAAWVGIGPDCGAANTSGTAATNIDLRGVTSGMVALSPAHMRSDDPKRWQVTPGYSGIYTGNIAGLYNFYALGIHYRP